MRRLFPLLIVLVMTGWPALGFADIARGWLAYLQRDYPTAYREFSISAEQGFAEAQFYLGFMYSNGQGVPKNDTEAVRWFRLAAEQGYAEAQYNLGFMYGSGLGVPNNDTEAVRWYRLAAGQGDANAQHNLGVMYSEGRGVPRDLVQAYMWESLAAAQGHQDARHNLEISESLMTREQIVEAQRLAAAFRPKGE